MRRPPPPPGPCGGKPHHFDLVTAHDAQGRTGDRGVCRRCGAVRFWLWPTAKQLAWTSLRTERVA